VTPSRTTLTISSSIDAIARSTLPGPTPARIDNGPSAMFASSELDT
jgi:hypothetical protein